MPLHKLTVQPTDAGERVDVWVAHALGLSRAQVKELAEGPGIRVNGRRVKRGDKLEAGAEVTLSWEPPSLELTVEHAPLTVLYEDAQLVAVDKPAQMASHPLKPGEVGTVANALAALHPECVQASEDPREGGLCHRLDGETSGVLLAARSREAWTAMRSAFSERRVDKELLGAGERPAGGRGRDRPPAAALRARRDLGAGGGGRRGNARGALALPRARSGGRLVVRAGADPHRRPPSGSRAPGGDRRAHRWEMHATAARRCPGSPASSCTRARWASRSRSPGSAWTCCLPCPGS